MNLRDPENAKAREKYIEHKRKRLNENAKEREKASRAKARHNSAEAK